MPVSAPVTGSIDPSKGALLDQVPPGVNPDKLIVLDVHTIAGPEIGPAEGVELTVTTVVAVHPFGIV